MNCKDCKYWKQHTYFTIKGIDVTNEKEFGKIFPIGILNYKSNYDKNTFEFIENKSNYGICKNEIVENMIDIGTTNCDGLTFDEKFGCIMFENKEI